MARKGDFIGFTFGDKHSSDLGIVRVSDGNRYSTSLTPSLTDKTIPIPGRDGSYYFGSYYVQKPITINFAFDSLTESQIRELQRTFSVKTPQKLIYDEAPYRYYLVKIANEPSLKTICFDEDGKRVYKGEGSLNLIAYFPYAKSRLKYSTQYGTELEKEAWLKYVTENHLGKWKDFIVCDNKDEWILASNLPERPEEYDSFQRDVAGKNYTAKIYNGGDLETGFILTFPFIDGMVGIQKSTLTLNQNGEISQLVFSAIPVKGQDTFLEINTNTELIEGFFEDSTGKKIRSGNIYNEHIIAGVFPRIARGEGSLNVLSMNSEPTISYDYLYY